MRKTKNKGFACSSEKSCQSCGNCLYICEAEEEVVLTEWNEPTDKYMACGGRKWEPPA